MNMSEVNVFAIQAQPGWAVLYPSFSDDSVCEICYEPVIAWRIKIDGDSHCAIPITADYCVGEGDGDGGGNILRRPDGTMFAPGDCDMPDEAAAKSWFEDRIRLANELARRERNKLHPAI